MEGSGGDQEVAGEMEIWGTWEELLLACAVSRHGTRSWDSVSMEVQARSRAAHPLTPHLCRQRYQDLQHRFAANGGCGDDDGDAQAEVPWLEELRKLRVAELRRDVERSDVSIVSLQLKVKKLKYERERNLPEAEAGEGSPDPKAREGKENGGGLPGTTPEAAVAGDRTSGRSCRESNSTDQKEEEDERLGEDDEKPEAPPLVDGTGDADPDAAVADEKAAREASYNGSTDTIAKAAVGGTNPERPGEAGESGESVAESKGEGEGEKESSDVQSSASLSRRRRRGRRRKTISGSSSGGDEAAEPAAASLPLVSFLEIIRSHEHGSVFARRLESQESARYQGTIRRHVDLEMVRARIDWKGGGGGAVYTRTEFFRDLLLLCNNAIVFYAQTSPEFSAAVHLRELVSKEMATIVPKAIPPLPPALPAIVAAVEKETTPSPPVPPPPVPLPAVIRKAKVDPDPPMPLLEKTTPAGPLITCRKRSSISTKRGASAAAKEEREEKPESAPHRNEEKIEGPNLSRRNTKERSTPTGTRALRTKSRANNSKGGSSLPAKNLNYGSSSTPVETNTETPPKGEKRSVVGNSTLAKKRSAANFLSRMKRRSGSPSTNGTLLEKLKSSSSGAGGKATAAEQRKGGRGDGRREQSGSRQGGKQAAVASTPAKRSVGRPPKRAAAPPSKRPRDEAAAPPAKRAREENAPPPKLPPRKRGRR